MKSTKKRGLGRGLDALLGAANAAPASLGAEFIESDQEQSKNLQHLPLENLKPGKYQPRRIITSEKLEDLAESIKQQGIMQPVVVRALESNAYEIIAGERRWRAAQLAGLEFIPCLIRQADDRDVIALALIENLQREDLNPLEEASALQRLQQEFNLTQQEVASSVGKSRSGVANLLRLLNLHKDVQLLLENGDLEMGHARALLSLPELQQVEIAREVAAKGMSVRQTESLVNKVQQQKTTAPKTLAKDPNIVKLEEQLQTKLGAKVKIQHGAKGKGRLEISYSSLEELDGILRHLR